MYKYKPVRFYSVVFLFTWLLWIMAAIINSFGNDNGISLLFMILGLFVPATTAVVFVFGSKSKALKNDFKKKLTGFYKIKPSSIIFAVLLFGIIVVVSIFASLLFGQSLDQLALTQDFSFSIGGTSALLTIVLASVIEEVGWRGYGEDSVASYCSWFKESIIFGLIWGMWHLPLFFIEGAYHYGLAQLGIGYVMNFFISVMSLGFLTTWVYLKNNRSMLACIVFHFFVNFFQEKIAMTPLTKCVETIIIIIVAVIIVYNNKEMFFETKHIGNLLDNEIA